MNETVVVNVDNCHLKLAALRQNRRKIGLRLKQEVH